MDGSARSDGEAEGATLLWVARNLAAALWIDRALQHALLWPLLACPLSPMDEFGTDLHLLLNLRVLMCVMFCGSRVVMIATLGQQNWGVMSSLKMVFGKNPQNDVAWCAACLSLFWHACLR